eukprot:tig00000057_g101.t1
MAAFVVGLPAAPGRFQVPSSTVGYAQTSSHRGSAAQRLLHGATAWNAVPARTFAPASSGRRLAGGESVEFLPGSAIMMAKAKGGKSKSKASSKPPPQKAPPKAQRRAPAEPATERAAEPAPAAAPAAAEELPAPPPTARDESAASPARAAGASSAVRAKKDVLLANWEYDVDDILTEEERVDRSNAGLDGTLEEMRRDIERMKRKSAPRDAGAQDEKPKYQELLNNFLAANVFVVAGFAVFFAVAVGLKSSGVTEAPLDFFVKIWDPVIQPVMGIMMGGAIVQGAYGYVQKKKEEKEAQQ